MRRTFSFSLLYSSNPTFCIICCNRKVSYNIPDSDEEEENESPPLSSPPKKKVKKEEGRHGQPGEVSFLSLGLMQVRLVVVQLLNSPADMRMMTTTS